MDDLVKQLRSLAAYEHSDLAIGDEAAACIEAQAAMLRECVEAGQKVVNDLDGKKMAGGGWVDLRDLSTTLTRAKEMLK